MTRVWSPCARGLPLSSQEGLSWACTSQPVFCCFFMQSHPLWTKGNFSEDKNKNTTLDNFIHLYFITSSNTELFWISNIKHHIFKGMTKTFLLILYNVLNIFSNYCPNLEETVEKQVPWIPTSDKMLFHISPWQPDKPFQKCLPSSPNPSLACWTRKALGFWKQWNYLSLHQLIQQEHILKMCFQWEQMQGENERCYGLCTEVKAN